MEWPQERLMNLRLAVAALAMQKAAVRHVSMLDAGQCTAEECIKRLLTDQVEAMKFIVGRRQATRLRQEIDGFLETGGDGD
jgi:hypothetical protein